MSVKVKVGNVFVSVRDGRKILAEYNRKFKIKGVRTMKGAALNEQLSKFKSMKTAGGLYRFSHRVRTGFKTLSAYHMFGTGAKRVAGKKATVVRRKAAGKAKTAAGKQSVKDKKAADKVKAKAKKEKDKIKAKAKKAKMKLKKAAAKAKAKEKAKMKKEKAKMKKAAKKAAKKGKKKKKKTVKAITDPHPPTGKNYKDGTPKFKGLTKTGKMIKSKAYKK